jgi:hypothetical protein
MPELCRLSDLRVTLAFYMSVHVLPDGEPDPRELKQAARECYWECQLDEAEAYHCLGCSLSWRRWAAAKAHIVYTMLVLPRCPIGTDIPSILDIPQKLEKEPLKGNPLQIMKVQIVWS